MRYSVRSRGLLARLGLVAGLTLPVLLPHSLAGCSLGNIRNDDCSSNNECSSLFGLGSQCSDGFCTSPFACGTGHDCRKMFGGGACVAGTCTATLPSDPACPITEPEDLLTKTALGDDSHIVLGALFALEAKLDEAQTKAARLAIREINRTGGAFKGRPLGLVICDNGGSMDSASGDERAKLNEHAMDYLAGTLGVPAIIGPLRSSDSLTVINRALSKGYPTVMISPSATSPALTSQPDKLHSEDPHGLFWRTCPSDELQGKVLADIVPVGRQVAVIYVQDAYGEGLSNVFRARYDGTVDPNTMTISKSQLFPFDDATVFSDLATQVAMSNPSVVIIISVQASTSISIVQELAKTAVAGGDFYFTDASKDDAVLLDQNLSPEVKAIIQKSLGTAPARPSGNNYNLFATNLQKDFAINADSFSFLAQSYDAGYVAAYGIVYASRNGNQYDGIQVAEGLSKLSSGLAVNIGPTDWTTGKNNISSGPLTIDIVGTSGDLNFDAAVGEAPASIEVWNVAPNLAGFETSQVIVPTP